MRESSPVNSEEMPLPPSQEVEDALAKLQANLTRHTRGNDRRMVLRCLKEVKYLHCIPMDPVLNGNPEDAEKEVSSDRVVVNGVSFLSGKSRPVGRSSDFLMILRELCAKLCMMEEVDIDPDVVYDQLIVRMARTISAADSYFKLNSLLGSPDLMVMPSQGKASQSKQALPPPVELEIYVSLGSVHASISCSNKYGLFRKADLRDMSGVIPGFPPDPMSEASAAATKGSRPWITIDAIVEERINFATGDNVRYLSVKLPNSLY